MSQLTNRMEAEDGADMDCFFYVVRIRNETGGIVGTIGRCYLLLRHRVHAWYVVCTRVHKYHARVCVCVTFIR